MTAATCTGPQCDRRALRRGPWCKQHQRQWDKHGAVKPLEPRRSIKGLTCTGPECSNPVNTNGLCVSHNSQRRRGRELTPIGQTVRERPLCAFPDCGRPHTAKGWCRPHREQERAGKGMWPVGEQPRAPKPKPKPKPRPLKLPDNVKPLRRERPAEGLPAGWFKPSRKNLKPTAPTAKQISQIIDVPPPNPQLEQMARENLIRMGATDLLDMLGLNEQKEKVA